MFERIPVPTPFEVGRVNAYLAGRTVVDPGPNSDKSWAELTGALAERGLEPDDIEQVLITHAHIDHFGLAERFREHGADIVASPEAARVMVDFNAHLEREQSYFAPFFERCGVDPTVADTVVTLPDPFVSYACSTPVDREVTEGDTIVVDDRMLRVERLGGHGPGEIGFSYEVDGQRRAIVGDTVLGHITPNPFMLPPPEEDGERPKQLYRYNQVLAKLEAESYDRLLSGHGELVTDPNARIREIRTANEHRTDTVRDLLDGPTLPTTVVDGLFGDLPLTETFAGMSEAIGHLEVLSERGEVECVSTPDEVRYQPVDA